MMPTAAGATTSGLRSSEVVDGDLVLILNNTIAAVEDARVQIERRLEPLELTPKVVNRLEVVLEELVSNVVRHGFEPGADGSIRLVVAARLETIDLTLEDDGVPFDPTEAAQPSPLESLETAKLGGLGIPLVRKLSASLRYEPGGPGDGRQLADRLFEPRNRILVSIARVA
jgi:anti-sigma regulatory factor (Ser/Thr protein kinase)